MDFRVGEVAHAAVVSNVDEVVYVADSVVQGVGVVGSVDVAEGSVEVEVEDEVDSEVEDAAEGHRLLMIVSKIAVGDFVWKSMKHDDDGKITPTTKNVMVDYSWLGGKRLFVP